MPAKTKPNKQSILIKTKFLIEVVKKRIKKFRGRKGPLFQERRRPFRIGGDEADTTVRTEGAYRAKQRAAPKCHRGGNLFSLLPLLVLTLFTAVIATQVSTQRFELRKKAQGEVEIGLARVGEGSLSPIQRLLNLLFPMRAGLPPRLSRENKELLQLGYPVPQIIIKQEGRILAVDQETRRVLVKEKLPLEFDASSSRGEIKGYTWTFGDFSELQEGANLTQVTHTYTEEGSYFLSLSLATGDVLKTNSSGLTIQVGTSKESQLIQSHNFEKYYQDHPDQRPPQLTQQELIQMKEDFEKLLQEKKQQREVSPQALAATSPDKIAIVVDRGTYDDLEVNGINLLDQYIQDVEANFPEVELLLKKGDFVPRSGVWMRGQLRTYWEQDHIDGAVLVGLLPYMVWEQKLFSEVEDQRGPCNLCFEDLDGRFYDTDNDGVYDTHYWDEVFGDKIEIWVAWMRPPTVDARGYLTRFLQKTHRYYQGPEPKGYRKEALFYAEESGPRGPFWEVPVVRNLFMAPLYGEPSVVDYNTHSEAKLLSGQAFLNELSRSPEFAFFAVHGQPGGVGFQPPTSPERIRAAAEGPLVTWAWSCSVANFYQAPSDNILQAFVFDSPGAQKKYNHAAIALPFTHTWGIEMPLVSGGFEAFFSRFFAGDYLGQALHEFKIKNARLHPSYSQWEGYPANNIPGFMLIGNPFVRHREPIQYPDSRPTIREISQASGSSIINILGSNFGSEQGRVLADGFEAEIRVWNDGGISATLPDPQNSLSSHIRVWTPGGGNSESMEFNYHRACYGFADGSASCYGYPAEGADTCERTGLACSDPCQGYMGTSSVPDDVSSVALSSSPRCRECTISGWVGCGQPLYYTNAFPVVLKYRGAELARSYPPTTQGQGSYELYHPLDPALAYTLELGDLPEGVTSDVHTITDAPRSAQYNFYLDSCNLTPAPPDGPPVTTCPDGSSRGQSCVGQWDCGDNYYCETGPQWCGNDNDLSDGYCCPDPNDPSPPPSACQGDEQIRFKWDKGGSLSIAAVSSDAPHANVRFSKDGIDISDTLIFVDRQSTRFGEDPNPFFDDPYLNPGKDHQWIYFLGSIMSSNLDDQRHDFNFYVNCPEGTPLEDCSSSLCTANYLDYQFKFDPAPVSIQVGDTVRIGVRSDKSPSDVMLRVDRYREDVTPQTLSWSGMPKQNPILNPVPTKKNVWAWNFTPQSSGLYTFYFYINCSSQNSQDSNCPIVELAGFSVGDR